jgi:hypothetical protein
VSLSGFAQGEAVYPCAPDVCADWNKNVALNYMGKGYYYLTNKPCEQYGSHWYLNENSIFDMFGGDFLVYDCWWENDFVLYTGILTIILFMTCNESTGQKAAIATLWLSGLFSEPQFLVSYTNLDFLDCSDVPLTINHHPSCGFSCMPDNSSAVLNFE